MSPLWALSPNPFILRWLGRHSQRYMLLMLDKEGGDDKFENTSGVAVLLPDSECYHYLCIINLTYHNWTPTPHYRCLAHLAGLLRSLSLEYWFLDPSHWLLVSWGWRWDLCFKRDIMNYSWNIKVWCTEKVIWKLKKD